MVHPADFLKIRKSLCCEPSAHQNRCLFLGFGGTQEGRRRATSNRWENLAEKREGAKEN